MSPKSKSPQKAAATTKTPAKKPAKATAAKGKSSHSDEEDLPKAQDELQAAEHAEEVEENEEASQAAASNSGGGNAAALAAASGSSEMSASFKNFRHHPDMENFYRFIFENDLRHEALAIIDEIIADKAQKKLAKTLKV